MCAPIALGIASGVGTAVTGIMEQNRAHRAQVDAVNRSNAIARQKYINDITISAYNDQRKGEVFTAQLQADAAARSSLYQQREINQIEANRASESAQQELREKVTEAMFASQENLAKAIQSQGTVLASGQQAGQSMMLTVDDVERKYGMQQAQLDASIFDATKAYGIKQFGVNLDQYNSDMSAVNNLSTSAVVAPIASFKTIRPTKQKAPPKPSILTPLLAGFSAGVGTWSGVKTALKP
jgi:hypothetical protein|tara:strand:- start:246 stop:962 length:717 start_codon:yes stop_codon:yes gene_type:complete